MPDRISWNRDSHEYSVERFWSIGAENFGNYHGGYLNFGLWKPGMDYVSAAENLVINTAHLSGLNKNSSLLDVACGMGAQDVLIFNKFGCKIDALDVTWKHVQSAEQRVPEAGLSDKIKLHHGTATDLRFTDSSFTHLISVEGAEEFNTREIFFKEAYRVLKPNGVIALSDFCIKRAPQGVFENFILWLGRRLWYIPKENVDTIESYRQKLERNGFRNVEIHSVGEYVIPGYYFEQCQKKTREEVHQIRGWFAAHPGSLIDWAAYKAFEIGLIDYILVRAQKP